MPESDLLSNQSHTQKNVTSERLNKRIDIFIAFVYQISVIGFEHSLLFIIAFKLLYPTLLLPTCLESSTIQQSACSPPQSAAVSEALAALRTAVVLPALGLDGSQSRAGRDGAMDARGFQIRCPLWTPMGP